MQLIDQPWLIDMEDRRARADRLTKFQPAFGAFGESSE